MVSVYVANKCFGTSANILGLLGNRWLEQQMFFGLEPKSALTLFAEMVGDDVCAPVIKRWLLRALVKKPEIMYTILDYAKQAYLLALG